MKKHTIKIDTVIPIKKLKLVQSVQSWPWNQKQTTQPLFHDSFRGRTRQAKDWEARKAARQTEQLALQDGPWDMEWDLVRTPQIWKDDLLRGLYRCFMIFIVFHSDYSVFYTWIHAGWWWLEHDLYFSIYWEESSQLTNILQRGWNHQPECAFVCFCVLQLDSMDINGIGDKMGDIAR